MTATLRSKQASAQQSAKVTAMELRRCPKCVERDVRLLEVPSRSGNVWYFRCNLCGHAWTSNKDGPQEVTEYRPKW